MSSSSSILLVPWANRLFWLQLRETYSQLMRRFLVAAVFLFTTLAPAALAEKPSVLLNTLPQEVRGKLASLFTANAIGQTGLNGQLNGTPATLFPIVKSALTKAGYSEQPIRTTIGPWGFSATWAPPSGVSVDGTASQKTAVLVTQATALGPERVNLNVRFEGL
ncbi:hypothetical protein [Prochlorococcus sp. MIT 0701]|nr:hypothetical protein EV14_1933 [Prochlorococcus sp. MIT 0703]